jgi:hypothetical protein
VWSRCGLARDPSLTTGTRIESVSNQLTREELVERLARISHDTWMRQKARDTDAVLEDLDAQVAPHDLERAEDTVQELERLGVWPPPPAH